MSVENSENPAIDDVPDALAAIERALARTNLIASIDVSGRGGNVFFLTVFDIHPEIVCCPIVQYTYSYILAAFGNATEIDAQAAYDFVTKTSYFRLVYQDPKGSIAELIERMGADLAAPLNRASLRGVLQRYFGRRQVISRRDLVLVPMLAYAAARGVDLDRVKYLLIGDAISMRDEHVTAGFSGRIVDAMIQDFPQARLLCLVRDPRATFASPRHQFVNSFGNMYAVAPGNYWARLKSLVMADLRMDNGCVYLYWLMYLRQATLAAGRQIACHDQSFAIIKNEDLNTNFVDTTQRLASWLDVECIPAWLSGNFIPTVGGAPWHGTGAYNSRYQRSVHGPLENDADDVASRNTGPNVYVTRRWRSRLNKREIELIEHLFRPELEQLDYEIMYDRPGRSDIASLVRTALLPFEGEVPTFAWLRLGAALSRHELFKRLFYALTFPPFYIGSRVLLAYFVLWRRLFRYGQLERTVLRNKII